MKFIRGRIDYERHNAVLYIGEGQLELFWCGGIFIEAWLLNIGIKFSVERG